MKTENFFVPFKELIIIDAEGVLNLSESRRALREFVSNPKYRERFEILFDLRDVECDLTAADIYELASAIAFPDSILPTRRKIAVVVSGKKEFEHAKFLELCANNRGVNMKSFSDIGEAANWLDTDVPDGLLEE